MFLQINSPDHCLGAELKENNYCTIELWEGQLQSLLLLMLEEGSESGLLFTALRNNHLLCWTDF